MSLFDMTEGKFLDTDKYDVFEFGRPPVAIDIMTQMKGVSFNEAFKDRIKCQIREDLTINVIHLNHLIAAKKASGRYKDLADIDYLLGL